ncbi:hypothetical protein CNR34_00142 [Pseudomonas phage nickie]|uniref:Uncharacterized protein n=1 Tax=Pseudomonas phage nickie TaxID=2048977 RepID=A0A2H4P7C9_9CAUD|nr:hypothetical protein FDJ16_gp023 [Pseudomonas phage nickie]ATW58075.1 hypothetical protein CNR34_00142 [Pseudomonas phage nickie]
MKNLAILLREMHAHEDGMTLEQYLGHFTRVFKEQGLFKLESCEGDTGFLLRSDDGTYHVWFMGTTTSPRYEGERYHVTETTTWAPEKLSEAMNALMMQMQIDCEGLIERNGEKYQ